MPVLDHFSEEVDELEDQVLDRPAPDTLARIFETKRSLITLRRVLVNTRDVAGHLQRTENDLIHRDMWPFLRDVYDHVARNLDLIEMQRDLLTGSLDIYLSSVANRTNQVMKVLTCGGHDRAADARDFQILRHEHERAAVDRFAERNGDRGGDHGGHDGGAADYFAAVPVVLKSALVGVGFKPALFPDLYPNARDCPRCNGGFRLALFRRG